MFGTWAGLKVVRCVKVIGSDSFGGKRKADIVSARSEGLRGANAFVVGLGRDAALNYLNRVMEVVCSHSTVEGYMRKNTQYCMYAQHKLQPNSMHKAHPTAKQCSCRRQ